MYKYIFISIIDEIISDSACSPIGNAIEKVNK